MQKFYICPLLSSLETHPEFAQAQEGEQMLEMALTPATPIPVIKKPWKTNPRHKMNKSGGAVGRLSELIALKKWPFLLQNSISNLPIPILSCADTLNGLISLEDSWRFLIRGSTRTLRNQRVSFVKLVDFYIISDYIEEVFDELW